MNFIIFGELLGKIVFKMSSKVQMLSGNPRRRVDRKKEKGLKTFPLHFVSRREAIIFA
jgi:hypothetical protein